MYQIPELRHFKNLIHAFSTVDEGNMLFLFNGQKTDKETVIKQRKKFLNEIGADIDNTVCLWLKHTDISIIADRKLAGISMKDKKFAVQADGLMTNEKKLFLFVGVADCLPITFFDPLKNVCALVHAGWLGADVNIAGKTVERLTINYGCNPKDLVIGIGPSARKDSFIKENPSQINDPKWKDFIEKKGKSFKVDFVGLCINQLIESGVKKENIFDSKIDTVKDKQFFSHYRDKFIEGHDDLGRFACVVGLNNI